MNLNEKAIWIADTRKMNGEESCDEEIANIPKVPSMISHSDAVKCKDMENDPVRPAQE